jgi:OmcA/MtrC family decaheme c-type cytochrome
MDGKFWFKALLTGLLLTTLVMAGCEGDDGDDGTAGASAYEIAVENGFTGTEQEWLDSLAAAGVDAGVAEPVETCVICHGEGSFADAEANHAITGQVTFEVASVIRLEADAGSTIEATVLVDGVPNAGFGTVAAAAAYAVGTTSDPNGSEYAYAGTDAIAVDNGDGTYTITVDPPSSVVVERDWTAEGIWPAAEVTWMIRLENLAGTLVNVVANETADDQHVNPVVSDLACINCHGNNIFRADNDTTRSYHKATVGVEACITCHTHNERNNLVEYVHGIHNAHNMPDGHYDLKGELLSTTYPTYMTNCSVCHNTAEGLPVANAMTVSGPNCLSCHGDMTSWDFVAAGVGFHTAYDGTESCVQCHNDTDDGIARATVAEFHNGLATGNAGLIQDGRDAAVTEGARIDHQITGVTRTSDSLAITWEATVDDVAVNPCNTTATVDAPTFTSGYSVLKAFFQGGDLVNADNGNSSPGQANSTNLVFGDNPATEVVEVANTVCAGNVATTTITLTPEEAALTGDARVALQGKPRILFAAADETISVRSKTPTFDFDLATGVAAGDDRRSIAVSENCLKCHVGSLYQHGGNRVDNVDLCVMCHNEASSEQNVREGMGVVASEAYDGKAGQTYGFKSMLHAIHSSGETGAPIVIYRNRGIYAWAADDSVLANWPGTGSQTVVGSDPASPNSIQNHNFNSPTYPRALNDCAACHADGFAMLPDQSVAVATTINAGSEPFDNQLDDVLEGASAAACMSCHQSGLSFEQNALKAHAYQNGWTPQTFEEGRQTIIDAAQ